MAQPRTKVRNAKAPNGSKPAASRRAGAQPITRHPLFPAIVALWFAALLGLGSFALRTALIERLIVAAHVDTLVTAAAPPLGVTARLLLALALGMIGGLVGFVLARRIGRAPTAPAAHVFNVAEADVDAPSGWPGMASSDAPAALPARARSAEIAATILEAEPEAALEPAVAIQARVAPTPTPQPSLLAAPVLAGPSAAERIAGAELASLSHVELIERLAIALQRRHAHDDSPADDSRSVLAFPDFVDRRNARAAAAIRPASAIAPASGGKTELALRDALVALQRISRQA